MSFRKGRYVQFSKFKVTSRKFTTLLLHWIESSRSWSLNNLQKCFLIFSESGPLTFLKIANPSSSIEQDSFFCIFQIIYEVRNCQQVCIFLLHQKQPLLRQTIHFLFFFSKFEQGWFSSMFNNSLVVGCYVNETFCKF